MAPEKSFAAAVDSICTILSARPPYCSGTYPLSLEQLTLFYGSDSSNVNKISLSAKSTPQDLDKLAAACQPATFGVNSEDVYDESYRKAVKMDPAEFAASFDVEDSGLVDIVRQGLRRVSTRNERSRWNCTSSMSTVYLPQFILGRVLKAAVCR